MWGLLLEAFDGPGAPVLYTILLVASFVGAVTVERARFLWWICRTEAEAVRAHLQRGDQAQARASLRDDPLGDVARAGLGETDPELGWEAMGAEAAQAEEELFARIPGLLTAGTIATMLGLLGTVLGLIVAFASLSDATQRAARLSDGVGAAMSTTALGLIVGIAATLVHGVLDARARRLQARMEILAREVALYLRRAGR
jgi:biopolymer transport protein ExbB